MDINENNREIRKTPVDEMGLENSTCHAENDGIRQSRKQYITT